jgi:hypothetical protein
MHANESYGLPRHGVAALQRVVVDERMLHRMQGSSSSGGPRDVVTVRRYPTVSVRHAVIRRPSICTVVGTALFVIAVFSSCRWTRFAPAREPAACCKFDPTLMSLTVDVHGRKKIGERSRFSLYTVIIRRVIQAGSTE